MTSKNGRDPSTKLGILESEPHFHNPLLSYFTLIRDAALDFLVLEFEMRKERCALVSGLELNIKGISVKLVKQGRSMRSSNEAR